MDSEALVEISKELHRVAELHSEVAIDDKQQREELSCYMRGLEFALKLVRKNHRNRGILFYQNQFCIDYDKAERMYEKEYGDL